MRKIKEVLRQHWEGRHSRRRIAESCRIARSTVGEYLMRAQAAGLSWPLPEEMDEKRLEAHLFPERPGRPQISRPLPDWKTLHEELRKKSMTLMLLWVEYKSEHPDGYQYSQFCRRYRDWKQSVDPCLRQEHKAGERLFVDYGGQTVPVMNRETGERRDAQIFTAVWGASNYTYAEATWTQQLPDWIESHVRALEFFGGCPELIIPDNLKSGVTQACRYEPDLNPTYQELAAHYGITVLPARPRKPRDKAKVEKGVQMVETWILARLRNRTFFSLTELNQAIHEGLEELNQRPFQKIPGTRQSLFESLERPVLKPLPAEPYTLAEWKKVLVTIDYHVEVDDHYYSVAYQYIRRKVDIRMTAKTVEIFCKGRRIAAHVRSFQKGGLTTLPEHRPQSHREYLSWTPERLQHQADSIGVFTAQAIAILLERSAHLVQGCRSCLGVLRLAKEFGQPRLEQACRRALLIQAISYTSIHSILKKGLDRLPPPEPPPPAQPLQHGNLRGAHYFH